MDPLRLVTTHFDTYLRHCKDTYGRKETAMWISSIDLESGRMSDPGDRRIDQIEMTVAPKKGCGVRPGKRVYRNIDAPRGSSLYWDLPLILAAHRLSVRTGSELYRERADSYLHDFLGRSVAPNGLLLWGNHYYYDVVRDETMWFHGDEDPRPFEPETDECFLHETRPISPPWELLWNTAPELTRAYLDAIWEHHVYNKETGGFNRHSDRKPGCAFLESGGIMVEGLAYLAGKTADPRDLRRALQPARFSFSNRGRDTDLLENNPDQRRWDKFVTTTEIGMWAGCLLNAYTYTGEREFFEMADRAVRAYLHHGFDPDAGRYFGKLEVATGRPVLTERTTPFEPDTYSDIFEPLFPTHEYPLDLAETSLRLLELTSNPVFREAATRFISVIENSLPARAGKGGYAEHYGKCISFLVHAARVLSEDRCRDLARRVAEEAVSYLYLDGALGDGIFRGHPGEYRLDAVDGIGFLLNGLLDLEDRG
jgi:hypothetical protein